MDGCTSKRSLSLEEKTKRYPEFMKASPQDLVPAMVVSEKVFYESLSMVELINDMNGGSLYPKDIFEKAIVTRWVIFIDKQIIPFFYRVLNGELEVLPTLEKNVKALTDQVRGPYFMGEEFGYVDLVWAPHF